LRSLRERLSICLGCISAFILLGLGFFIVFSPLVDPNIAAVLALIAGALGIYVILAVCDIIKEFSLKGAGFEFTSKLEEKIKDVKQDVKDSKEEMNARFHEIHQNISTLQNTFVSAKLTSVSDQKQILVLGNLIQSLTDITEEKKAETIARVGIGKEIDPTKKIEVSMDIQDEIKRLYEKQKALEEMHRQLLERPVAPPIDVKTILSEANYHFHTGEYDKAIELYEAILKIDPDNTFALGNYAYALAKKGRYEDAIKIRKRLLQIIPNHANSLIGLSHYMLRLKKPDQAIEYLEKYLNLYSQDHPVYGSALYNMACAYSQLNKTQLAIDSLKKATSKDDQMKKMAQEDEDFDNIRNEEEFRTIVKC
jgi:tetratricopeptide (TPR) repeat protein